MSKAYAIIHRANWPIDGQAKLHCFATRAMAEEAARDLVAQSKREGSALWRLALSDLIILEVKPTK